MEQSFLQQLDLDRPERWVMEASEEAADLISQKLGVFGEMTTDFLLTQHHEKLLVVLKLNNLGTSAIALCQLMFHVGYIIGLSRGETRGTRDQQLKKLLGEEEH